MEGKKTYQLIETKESRRRGARLGKRFILDYIMGKTDTLRAMVDIDFKQLLARYPAGHHYPQLTFQALDTSATGTSAVDALRGDSLVSNSSVFANQANARVNILAANHRTVEPVDNVVGATARLSQIQISTRLEKKT